ncbi:MAG: peptidylprolyl isomerase [Ignavibacteria bacterium]
MDKPKKQAPKGVMNKLRDKMPLIIIFLIVAFLGTIIFEWGMNYLGLRTQKVVFAKVNGEEISYEEYNKLLEQQLDAFKKQNNGKDPDDVNLANLKEQVWNSLVQQVLMKQEMKKLGITVSDNEIIDWIYNNPETLPEEIKRNFMDSTGVFNYDLYQQALSMKTQEVTQFWAQVEAYLREVLLAEKLQQKLLSTVNVTEGEVLQKYRDDYLTADINYVLLDINSVTDTNLFKVTDDELRKYYDEHKEEFKQDAAVRFKYLIFSDTPTSEDSALIYKQLQSLVKLMKNATVEDSSLIKLVNEESAFPYNDQFQKPGGLQSGALNFLFSAKKDSTSDVIKDADGYKVIKLLDIREGEDTYVNASHILVNFGTDTTTAKKRAEEILARLKKGEKFEDVAREVSDDPSAKTNNGNLGWFTKGVMVKEFEDACFNAKVGELIGPIKTQYGFHIIKLNDRSKKEFKFAEIRRAVTPSPRTKDIARKRAADFVKQIEQGSSMFSCGRGGKITFDSLAKSMNINVNVTPEITEDGSVPGIGQNKTLINFGLDNKVGKLFGPVKVQGGFGVYQIVQKIQAGYKNFDSIKVSFIKPLVERQKKYDYLISKANEMKGKIVNGDLMSLKTQYPQYIYDSADSMSVSKPNNKIGIEYPIFNAIYNMKIGEISQPIKATRGIYIVQVKNMKGFDENEYATKQADIRKQLMTNKQQTFVQEWLTEVKNKAKIEDNRDRFFL